MASCLKFLVFLGPFLALSCSKNGSNGSANRVSGNPQTELIQYRKMESSRSPNLSTRAQNILERAESGLVSASNHLQGYNSTVQASCKNQKQLQKDLQVALQSLVSHRPNMDLAQFPSAYLTPVKNNFALYNDAISQTRHAKKLSLALNACKKGGDESNRKNGKPYLANVADAALGAAMLVDATLSNLRLAIRTLTQNKYLAHYTCTTRTEVNGATVYTTEFTLSPGTIRWLYTVGELDVLKPNTVLTKEEEKATGEKDIAITLSHDSETGELKYQTERWKEFKFLAPQVFELKHTRPFARSVSTISCKPDLN